MPVGTAVAYALAEILIVSEVTLNYRFVVAPTEN
jgi:hypothetical protein